jgi:hypothetical protein
MNQPSDELLLSTAIQSWNTRTTPVVDTAVKLANEIEAEPPDYDDPSWTKARVVTAAEFKRLLTGDRT